MVGVTGSIPVVPTILTPIAILSTHGVTLVRDTALGAVVCFQVEFAT
jgi:hypothetical protein